MPPLLGKPVYMMWFSKCFASSFCCRNKLLDAPTCTEKRDDADVIPVVVGDEMSEQKSKIYKQVISKRKERQTFYHLPNWGKKPWGDAGDAIGI